MSVTALVPGALFAERYEVVQCIDFGGMGAIYEVIHLQTKRRRALKIMLPDVVENDDLRRRFKLEATVAAEVESEHIVETFDAGVDTATGSPFLVMELLRGATLKALLKRIDRLDPGSVLHLLRQVAMGLDKTHAAGIVHRDLKPDNVFLIKRDDGALRVKILDFGIAKVVAAVTHPSKTKVMGTPLYMAPEQLTGDGSVGPPADLYALAQLAFTLLAGQAFWQSEADASESIFNFLLKVMQGEPDPASERAAELGVELPDTFDAWFSRATAKLPADRPASATEQVEELEALFPDVGVKPSEAVMAAFDQTLEEADEKRRRAGATTAVRDAVREADDRPSNPLDTKPKRSQPPVAGVSSSSVSTDAGATQVGVTVPAQQPRTKQALWVALGAGAVIAGAAALGAFADEPAPAAPPVAPAAKPEKPAPEPKAESEHANEAEAEAENEHEHENEAEAEAENEAEHEPKNEALPAPSAKPLPKAPVPRPWPQTKKPPPPPPPPPEPVDPLKIR